MQQNGCINNVSKSEGGFVASVLPVHALHLDVHGEVPILQNQLCNLDVETKSGQDILQDDGRQIDVEWDIRGPIVEPDSTVLELVRPLIVNEEFEKVCSKGKQP